MIRLNFSDLYLGKETRFFAGTGKDGDDLISPDDYKELLDELYDLLCEKMTDLGGDTEITFAWQGRYFRVSPLESIMDRIFVLRGMPVSVPDLSGLGIHPALLKQLMRPELTGLIIVSGAFASGKTTTASSLVRERLIRLGGVAVTIEDPPEMPLNGQQGKGICFQTAVNETEGNTFQSLTKRSARWAPDIIFMGEIRDAEAATEALRSAQNGRLVICTFHAEGISSALERLYTMIAGQALEGADASSLLASSVKAVLHQRLDQKEKSSILKTDFLFLEDGSSVGANLIKTRKFGQLESEIRLQLNQMLNGI